MRNPEPDYGLCSKTDSEMGLVFNSDREASAHVSEIDAVQPDLPDQSVRLYDPGIILIEQLLHPAPCCVLGHGMHVVATASIHSNDFGVCSELEPSIEIVFAGTAQSDANAFENRKLWAAHAR